MSRRKHKLPDPVTATIESLSHDGRGVTHIGGKTVFVDGALPGENVRIKYLRTRSKRDEAEAIEVLEASPRRIEPFCPHFNSCGGCSLQHLDPCSQLEHKQQVLMEQLLHIGRAEPQQVLEPLSGPVRGYRHKARLGVKYVFKKEKLLAGFREKRSSFVADINQCGVLHPSVGDLLPDLKELIAGLSIYNRIPQVEVAVGDEQTALVIRHLQPPTEEDRARLQRFEREHGIRFYLQSGGPDTVSPLNGTAEDEGLYYTFHEEGLILHFNPLDFTQINFSMNRAMLKCIRDLLEPKKDDSLLDLFCGVGNFSLPLSRDVGRVTGVEGDPGLIATAGRNARLNNITNTEFHQADLYRENLEAAFLRHRYDKVLLDPPRGGARDVLHNLNHGGIDRIVYVSCNPATLARDTYMLVHENGYRLEKAGVIDMFPHTSHVESIAQFQR